MPAKRKRDYKKEYKRDHSSAAAKKARAARNKARRHHAKKGNVSKGDGKDVHHKKPLARGGSRSVKNTTVTSRKSNRAAGARMVSKASKAKGGRRSKR